jgi:ADP-ribose pyrophosphatase YjhB (NUDIX family)
MRWTTSQRRGQVIVVLEDEHVLLFRELRGGTVRHLAPGAATHPGETPGKAAARAAREQLGVTVDVTELLFANTENGVWHFFFVASPNERVVLDSDVQRHPSEHLAATAVKRTALLAYPVRPRRSRPAASSCRGGVRPTRLSHARVANTGRIPNPEQAAKRHGVCVGGRRPRLDRCGRSPRSVVGARGTRGRRSRCGSLSWRRPLRPGP